MTDEISFAECCQILKLPQTASLVQAKKQHNAMAKLYHPDKKRFSKEKCTEEFIKIRKAYDAFKKYSLAKQQVACSVNSQIRRQATANELKRKRNAEAVREAWNTAARNKQIQQQREEWERDNSPLRGPFKAWWKPRKVVRQRQSAPESPTFPLKPTVKK